MQLSYKLLCGLCCGNSNLTNKTFSPLLLQLSCWKTTLNDLNWNVNGILLQNQNHKKLLFTVSQKSYKLVKDTFQCEFSLWLFYEIKVPGNENFAPFLKPSYIALMHNILILSDLVKHAKQFFYPCRFGNKCNVLLLISEAWN